MPYHFGKGNVIYFPEHFSVFPFVYTNKYSSLNFCRMYNTATNVESSTVIYDQVSTVARVSTSGQ